MNNIQLVENACDELTYAASTLNLIINNDIVADADLFNTLEGIIENIKRAKKSVCDINTQNNNIPVGSLKIMGGETLETIIGTATNTLKTVENLKVATESGILKNSETNAINLIQSVRLNLESIYEKVSAEG